jgi:transposase
MLLTKEEKNRIEIISAVIEGKIALEDAALLLALSERQVYRLIAKAQAEDIRHVLHGNKGREPANKTDDDFWAEVVALVKEHYPGVNDLHLQELLKREHDIEVGRESLRKRLRSAGLAPKRKHRPKKYRARRERKAAFGMMLQLEASDHDWLEGRGPRLTLLGAIDDATSFAWCRFAEEEATWGYLALLRSIVLKEGVPLALYSDRHTIFHSPREPTIIEQLQNEQPLTQFGRACRELGIQIRKAYSPQAKGRIERLWEFMQDRLVVEMRLNGVATQHAANQFLPRFLTRRNEHFTVAARHSEAVFRPAPRAKALDRMLCLKQTRVVNADHTISYQGLILQLPRSSQYASIARQRVEVLELRDGSLEVIYKQQPILRLTRAIIEKMKERK